MERSGEVGQWGKKRAESMVGCGKKYSLINSSCNDIMIKLT